MALLFISKYEPKQLIQINHIVTVDATMRMEILGLVSILSHHLEHLVQDRKVDIQIGPDTLPEHETGLPFLPIVFRCHSSKLAIDHIDNLLAFCFGDKDGKILIVTC